MKRLGFFFVFLHLRPRQHVLNMTECRFLFVSDSNGKVHPRGEVPMDLLGKPKFLECLFLLLLLMKCLSVFEQCYVFWGQPYSFTCLRLYLPLYFNISLIILTKLYIILRRLVEVDFIFQLSATSTS